jgi:hypothetical protein
MPYPHGLFRAVQEHLTEAFGGTTAFTRAPAEGTACADEKDQIVVFEVMSDELDRMWRPRISHRPRAHLQAARSSHPEPSDSFAVIVQPGHRGW